MEDLIFYIHLTFLATAAIGILIADKAAFSWLRGKIETVDSRTTFIAHWIVTIGLCGLVLSGLYLFWPMQSYLLRQPLFLLKMAFVIALFINSFLIDYLIHTAQGQSYSSLSSTRKLLFLISGAVSTICWVGAVSAAITLFGWDTLFR